MHQIRLRLGFCPDPAGGAHTAPPDSLAGFKGPTCKGARRGREGGEGGEGKGKEKEMGGRGVIWNKLPTEIQKLSSLFLFKTRLEKYLIDRY